MNSPPRPARCAVRCSAVLRQARVCYDHLAGEMGAAVLARLYALHWAAPAKTGRAVLFSSNGRKKFYAAITR